MKDPGMMAYVSKLAEEGGLTLRDLRYHDTDMVEFWFHGTFVYRVLGLDNAEHFVKGFIKARQFVYGDCLMVPRPVV